MNIVFYDLYAVLCKQKGVSCSKAAEEIGLSNSTVTKWKKTGATPTGETLSKVAAYFGISTDELLENKNIPVVPDELIAFYGQVKGDLSQDDIDDLMVSMRAKAERNKKRTSGV